MKRKTYNNVLKAGKLIEKKGIANRSRWKLLYRNLMSWQHLTTECP